MSWGWRKVEIDTLTGAISIAGGISTISVTVSGGSKGGLSKIIGWQIVKKTYSGNFVDGNEQ